MQHAVEPLGQVSPGRDFVRDTGIADLRFRADDALREGCGRRQECAGDFLGSKSAYLAQGQRDLGICRQRRMTAREDEPQPVIFEVLVKTLRHIGAFAIQAIRDLGLGGIQPDSPPQPVHRLEAPCRDQPRAGILRDAIARPLFDRSAESLVQCLLGEVEIMEQSDERGQNAARLGEIDLRHDRRDVSCLRHRRKIPKPLRRKQPRGDPLRGRARC